MDGRGAECTRRDPCSNWNAALRAARPGDVVNVLPGHHGSQKLRKADAKPVGSAPVLFRGAGTGSTRVGQLDVEVPETTFASLQVTSEVRVRRTASGTTLSMLQVNGIVDLEADRSALLDSRVAPPADRDAVQVRSGAADVAIRGNVIGPGPRTGANHVDCVQVSWASRLQITGNTLYRCATQSLHLKPDRGDVVDVLVQGNAIQGCVPRSDACNGYNAFDVRTAGHDIRDIRVIGNTVHGGVTFDDVPGLVLQRNLMNDHPGCLVGSTDNVFGRGGCDRPEANAVRSVRFVAPDADPPDLRAVPECACAGYGAR
ncbi:MAG: hypothetical protein F2825_11585 [Actinobacteria bacterium]|uniref:Unannotated protein n=1 Tax=freshwater metagenome TaxID=449393 RepID=A0A6J7IVI6_9ZZZZ|nr:hypothetical protein [Actinomycetota bacterium]